MNITRAAVTRWIRKGLLTNEKINQCGFNTKESLVEYLMGISYCDLSHSDKENIAHALKDGMGISKMTFDEIRQYGSKIRSMRSSIGWEKMDPDVKKHLYASRDTTTTRIEKVKCIHPDWNDEQCLHESYIQGLVTKGSKQAERLGFDTSLMTDAELMSLTGFQKKITHSKRNPDEVKVAKINWKLQNLKHTGHQLILKKEFVEFSNINLDAISDDMVEEWYKKLLSIRTSNAILRSEKERKSRFKTGYYLSSKTGEKHYYRSSYEYECMVILDSIQRIETFKTEPYHLKFYDTEEKFLFTYVPDLEVTLRNGVIILIELKGEHLIEKFLKSKAEKIQSEYPNFHILTKQYITKDNINAIIDAYFEK